MVLLTLCSCCPHWSEQHSVSHVSLTICSTSVLDQSQLETVLSAPLSQSVPRSSQIFRAERDSALTTVTGMSETAERPC